MIIDYHTHLGIDSNKTGCSLKSDELLRNMDDYGIDKSVIFACPNISPSTKNPYERENEKILEESAKESRLIPFMFIHPYFDSLDYINSMKDSFKGFKIYSSAKDMEYSYKQIQDTEIFKIISPSNKPLTIHTSVGNGGNARDLVSSIKDYRGPVLIAHIARLSHLDLESIADLENVYIDISPFNSMLSNPKFLSKNIHESIKDLSPEKIITYLRNNFSNRIVWGTDSPWSDSLCQEGYKKEVELFRRLGLDKSCVNLLE